jgi:dUTP pyrophosphatase
MYQTKLSAGYDLTSAEENIIHSNRRVIVDTGVYLKDVLPPDMHVGAANGTDVVPCAMVCSRSGLAAKEGLIVLNAPGIIDMDYKDTIKVILYNTSETYSYINKGDRIAQLVFAYAYRKTELVKGADRDGGLGSTGG